MIGGVLRCVGAREEPSSIKLDLCASLEGIQRPRKGIDVFHTDVKASSFRFDDFSDMRLLCWYAVRRVCVRGVPHKPCVSGDPQDIRSYIQTTKQQNKEEVKLRRCLVVYRRTTSN